ncbi:MAG: hypothetical protein RI556_10345 [Hydrogenovibrio sp.]|uniref:hypothetical protein n=1 Tax=Hydrogenovibrio sp. TaxID=2065821 RepID=UPI00286FD7D8|nr:hypothetical protein [Hydrogenovibrio sp.]MDR9499563.1 hypothetical protein [Hydrogenovibrio sp.]
MSSKNSNVLLPKTHPKPPGLVKNTVTLSEAEGSLKTEPNSKDPSAAVGMTKFMIAIPKPNTNRKKPVINRWGCQGPITKISLCFLALPQEMSLALSERSEFARALWQGLERTESVCWVCFFGSFFAQANEELGARRGKPRKNEHICSCAVKKSEHNH